MGQRHMVKTSLAVSKQAARQHKAGEQRPVFEQSIYCRLTVAVHRAWKAAYPSERRGQVTHTVK